MAARCLNCGSGRPGKHGFNDAENCHRYRRDCITHPLCALFRAAPMTNEAGMNWLQDHGLIADECVEFWQVAPCDLWEVLEQAAFRFNPAWLAALRKYYEERELSH